jgi:hypothetical protein
LGDCLLWVVFLKITDVDQTIGQLFSAVKVMSVLIVTEIALGYILGEFFANASGHTARHFLFSSFSASAAAADLLAYSPKFLRALCEGNE